jgi:hypothetical protein
VIRGEEDDFEVSGFLEKPELRQTHHVLHNFSLLNHGRSQYAATLTLGSNCCMAAYRAVKSIQLLLPIAVSGSQFEMLALDLLSQI